MLATPEAATLRPLPYARTRVCVLEFEADCRLSFSGHRQYTQQEAVAGWSTWSPVVRDDHG